MPTLDDISIINSNTAEATPVESGLERTLCSESVCGSKQLDVFRRTISAGKALSVEAGEDYHVVYIMDASKDGTVSFNGDSHAADEGAGVLLAPGETAEFKAGSDMELLHMVAPKPPAAVEGGLPGGPGYVFNQDTLRYLTDNSGGRIRRFCADSSVMLKDGSRLTSTNAIQAGEMRYLEGGSSPYHQHMPTEENPEGAAHCYMTFYGRGQVEVGDTSQEVEPGTLIYFPPGVPHRLRAVGGVLDYFEIQAWRSFKTNVLSEEELGLRWYYDPETPGGERDEWNQT